MQIERVVADPARVWTATPLTVDASPNRFYHPSRLDGADLEQQNADHIWPFQPAHEVRVAYCGGQSLECSCSRGDQVERPSVFRRHGKQDERPVRPLRPLAFIDEKAGEGLFAEHGQSTVPVSCSFPIPARGNRHVRHTPSTGTRSSGTTFGEGCGAAPIDTGSPPRLTECWTASSIRTTRRPAWPSLNGCCPEFTQSRK